MKICKFTISNTQASHGHRYLPIGISPLQPIAYPFATPVPRIMAWLPSGGMLVYGAGSNLVLDSLVGRANSSTWLSTEAPIAGVCVSRCERYLVTSHIGMTQDPKVGCVEH